MSKRKTREQKIIADLRRKIQDPITPLQRSPKEYVLAETLIKPPSSSSITSISSTNMLTQTMLVKDLQKTTFVTCAIITAELLLYFLLKQHIVSLPMIQF